MNKSCVCEKNLVYFSLNMWHPVAIILTIFLIINWPNVVYLLVDPGHLSPLNFYEASRFVHPWQTQGTNGRVYLSVCLLVCSCLRRSLTLSMERMFYISSLSDDDDIQREIRSMFSRCNLFIYLFIFNSRHKAHDTKIINTIQHRKQHTYNTYYYKRLKQNTTPPLKKRWLKINVTG